MAFLSMWHYHSKSGTAILLPFVSSGHGQLGSPILTLHNKQTKYKSFLQFSSPKKKHDNDIMKNLTNLYN